MIKHLFTYKPEHIPDDWKKHCVIIWEEDDVPYIDKENTSTAFERITGRTPNDYIHIIDEGDVTYYFYRGGWVRCISYDGGFVGLLIKKEE